MRFVPTLQTMTVEDFDAQFTRLQPHFNRFSVDVQDGKFTPTYTISTQDVASYFHSHQISKDFIFDFDLMTHDYQNALKIIEDLSQIITVGSIFVHVNLLNGAPLPHSEKIAIGIALDVENKAEHLEQYGSLETIPSIQIMTIHAGAQGQALIPEMLTKIATLRKNNYRNKIYIDGGVKDTNIDMILSQEYKPDFACVGGYLSKAGDKLQERIGYLKSKEE